MMETIAWLAISNVVLGLLLLVMGLWTLKREQDRAEGISSPFMLSTRREEKPQKEENEGCELCKLVRYSVRRGQGGFRCNVCGRKSHFDDIFYSFLDTGYHDGYLSHRIRMLDDIYCECGEKFDDIIIRCDDAPDFYDVTGDFDFLGNRRKDE